MEWAPRNTPQSGACSSLLGSLRDLGKLVAVVQLLSHVWLFVTPWNAACQACLNFTISWILLKFMFIELVLLSNHFRLCHPLLFLPSIFPNNSRKYKAPLGGIKGGLVYRETCLVFRYEDSILKIHQLLNLMKCWRAFRRHRRSIDDVSPSHNYFREQAECMYVYFSG